MKLTEVKSKLEQMRDVTKVVTLSLVNGETAQFTIRPLTEEKQSEVYDKSTANGKTNLKKFSQLIRDWVIADWGGDLEDPCTAENRKFLWENVPGLSAELTEKAREFGEEVFTRAAERKENLLDS